MSVEQPIDGRLLTGANPVEQAFGFRGIGGRNSHNSPLFT
jgi:hypothetical protein